MLFATAVAVWLSAGMMMVTPLSVVFLTSSRTRARRSEQVRISSRPEEEDRHRGSQQQQRVVLFSANNDDFHHRRAADGHENTTVIPPSSSTGRDGGHIYKKPFRRKEATTIFDSNKLEWLEQATDRLIRQCTTEQQLDGSNSSSMNRGKYHEVGSLIQAWSNFQKVEGQAPVRMEALLKLLVDERRRRGAAEAQARLATDINNNKTTAVAAAAAAEVLTIELYNQVLDAWACAALFRTVQVPGLASQRAREILVMLQANYEQEASVAGIRSSSSIRTIKPNSESFDLVLHAVARTEGALNARRVLAWMEYLHKTRKNKYAKPNRSNYIHVLAAYARADTPQAGSLASAFLRHIKHQDFHLDLKLPDTLCYNIAIKAWNNQKHNRRRGREAAEQADRILEEMKHENPVWCRPDIVTYGSAISAWAASGMKAHAVSRAEELLREVEDSDMLEPNTIVLNAVMSAWVKSRSPGAVERTEEILRQMELSTHARPDLISYNTHLHTLSLHSSSRRPDLSRRAESLVRKMEKGYDNGDLFFAPNVFSYNLAIESICRIQNSSTAMRAARLLRQLITREGVEPDTFSFNQVLAALSRSSAVGSASTAEELLRYMDASFQSGLHQNAIPDASSFTFVINAYARSGEKGSAENGQRLLEEMKRRAASGEAHLKPTRTCYNSLIDCWAKSGEGTLGARRAEALLQEMKDMFAAGEKSVAPNLITFNAVLNAWARSNTRCSGYQAEKYLDKMWELYHAGDKRVKPNDFSYNTVINAISKGKNEQKAQKALRILRRMDKLYQAGYKEARPNEITYTAVINSCAFPSVPDSRTRRKALDTAMFTLKELQGSRYGHPNQVTYGTFIKACSNLLHDDENMRREIIKRAFEQCCRDGQVGKMVLKYTPRDLRDELLAGYIEPSSINRIAMQDLPAEWQRNVRDKDAWRSRKPRRQTVVRRPKLKP